MLRAVSVLIAVLALGAAEFVPALVWQFGPDADPVKIEPALHKVPMENFRDLLSKQAANKDLVIIFAEENLSVEDFNWQDGEGSSSFAKLTGLSDGIHSSFYSHVEDPMDGVSAINGAQWANIKLGLDLPSNILGKRLTSKFILVNMDDASDLEDRPNLLNRHDDIVSRTLEAAKSAYGRVLAVYTGYHTSWTPEEVAIRKVRSLLQIEEPTNGTRFINADFKAFLYYSSAPLIETGTTSILLVSFVEATVTEEEDAPLKLNVVYNHEGENITIIFPFAESHRGYWNLDTIQLQRGDEELNLGSTGIYAPFRFSYHCAANTVFGNKTTGSSITFTDFQIQPLPPNGEDKEERFSDAYDCVSFFTMPILSGIMVSILLLFIISLGLGMIVDIKVMDRFDDPKGKTISVTNTD